AQTRLLDVLGHANHVRTWYGVRADLHALANGILAGPERPGHGLTDHHGARCALYVGSGDATPLHHARAHGREVVRCHGVEVELAQPTHRIDTRHVQIEVPHAPERRRELPR